MKKVEKIEELTPVEIEEKEKKRWNLIAVGSLLNAAAIIISYVLCNYKLPVFYKENDLDNSISQSDVTEYSYSEPIGYELEENKVVKLDYYINNSDYEVITAAAIANTIYTAPNGFVRSGDKCVKSFTVSTDTTIDDIKKDYPESEGFTVVQDGSRYVVTCEAKKETIYTAPDGFSLTKTKDGQMIAYKIIEKGVAKTLK